MTGPDLIRLAEELARCGGVHRLTNLVTAAVHVALEHERRHRPPCVEDWETGPHGVGMTDKAGMTRCRATGEAPERDCEAGRPTDCASDRRGSTGPGTPLPSISPTATQTVRTASSPHPAMPERGEGGPLSAGRAVVDKCDQHDFRPPRPVTQDESDVLREALLASSTVVAPGRLRTGNALAEERGGIVHHPGSKVAAEFGPSDPAKRLVPRPGDPTITAGDSA